MTRSRDNHQLQQTLVSSAKAFDLSFRRYQAMEGGALRIWMEPVNLADLLRWLQELSARYQLDVEALSVAPEAGSNLLSVRLDIRA